MYYPSIMASLIKKIKKGKPYYYAVESARVDGKPRIVWQKYLGTLDAILNRSDAAKPIPPKESVIFEAGGIAALLRITQQLQLLELINEILPKREQGLSVAHYILLAAFNRALDPCSKLAIGDWYEKSILRKMWHFPTSAFSSQRFWDHMDRIEDHHILEIEQRLLLRIKERFGINPDLLLYDTTNFFTYLATSNDRANLPQRGHSKAKRHDLCQVGLALMLSRDFQVPLLHHTYSGNIPDVKLFPQICQQLLARYRQITSDTPEATLVFDKGNVSEQAMEQLTVHGIHFVAALSANCMPEILQVSTDQFHNIHTMPGTKAFCTVAPLWGKELQVVVSYTESFFAQQLSGITQNMVKAQTRLSDLHRRLSKWHNGQARGKRPSVASVRREVNEILAPQFMSTLFKVKIQNKSALPTISYSVDHRALEQLSRTRLGKILLVTDHLTWTPEQVIGAYRTLSRIEDTFKKMKNVRFLRWQPAYHWTDQKLKVHAFYCVLALLLCSLAHKELRQAQIDISLTTMLKELCAIKQVALLYPEGAGLKSHITLSRMTPRQRKLAEVLQIQPLIAEG